MDISGEERRGERGEKRTRWEEGGEGRRRVGGGDGGDGDSGRRGWRGEERGGEDVGGEGEAYHIGEAVGHVHIHVGGGGVEWGRWRRGGGGCGTRCGVATRLRRVSTPGDLLI